MKSSDEIRITVEIMTLSEDTRAFIKAKLLGHLCFVGNTCGKEKANAIQDLLNDFKKIGLA